MLTDAAPRGHPPMVRLAGGIVCDALGLEPRGRRLDALLAPSSAADLIGLGRDLPDDRPVGLWSGTLTRHDGAPMSAKGLVVALSSDNPTKTDLDSAQRFGAPGLLLFFDDLTPWAGNRGEGPRIDKAVGLGS